MDCLFIAPRISRATYQELADTYTAIETPTWSLLLAESCRSIGYDVGILDMNAERLSDEEMIRRIEDAEPRLICFPVYGSNPNSGSLMMGDAIHLAGVIKYFICDYPICFVGSHMSALPYDVLNNHQEIDLILTNEGVYALRNLLGNELDVNRLHELKHVKGLGLRDENGVAFLTEPEQIVPQEKMDEDLPGYAWDLLPYDERPLDMYRSHFFHAEYKHEKRTPFAALYTSLGCMFKCSFCMINILNKDDNDPIGVASNYAKMRFWSPEFIIKEFDKLYEMGVRTIRISDEMFLLNRKYYVPLCELLKERGYGKHLNMWVYSRIDTINDKSNLKLLRDAGIRMVALGIESADKTVRLEVTKGKFEDVNIVDVINKCREHGIEPTGNYIFGLPGDTYESMIKTLQMSMELNTTVWNAYTAMPLPGSALYKEARDNNHPLPKNYNDWSFFSPNLEPLPTATLTSQDILEFRDQAWTEYHTNPKFLYTIEQKYGKIARENIEKMAEIKLKRRLLEE
ncbi:MAG: B12-binding domain-containing radical SAM protein [Spirochaetes bacterium]|nr:B12-binding domain-containing radical SAM protein [Spirochaetota bacterium]